LDEKQRLRARLRALRRDHAASLPESMRGLVFLRPPGNVATMAPEGSTVGLYHAAPAEAPMRGYAKWFYENGRHIALPWFAANDSRMQFRLWRDPYDDSDLEVGPFGILQPSDQAALVQPQVAFVPVLGFTPRGERLGQGGGHYDRWLEANPAVVPIGIAWDCQRVDALPSEAHDRHLHGVITPTRYYEGAA
jgi:5-formyltetrahydrofolate cyclo-ligase